MAGEIIPFGKYKGQDIDTVRQRDPQYLQWLTQQAWFQEKFAPVYQIVVNNFAPASEDTPAHNALQVRFLEGNFRRAFWNATGIKTNWHALHSQWHDNISHLRKPVPPCKERRTLHTGSEYMREWSQRAVKMHRSRVLDRWAIWREIRRSPSQHTFVYGPKFETVSDVEFTVENCVGYSETSFRNLNAVFDYRLMIEIKPCMGDDYPAVLRQIKRQQTTAQMIGGRRYWFLLVDEFGSNSVTLDQVRAIFAADNIIVLLVADVREQLIKLQRGSHG